MLSHCQTQNEVEVVNAFYSISVYQSETDYTNQLIDLLARWRWMSGINSANQDEDDMAKELILMASFFKKNYHKLTLEEVSLAIDLSLTNKLDVDVRTFNSFSPMYISKILNAYIDYRNGIVFDLKSKSDRLKEKELVEKKSTPQEKMDGVIDLIKYLYDKYKEDGVVDDYFGTLYSFMKRINKMNPSEATIQEAKEYGKEMARNKNNNLLDNLKLENSNSEYAEKRYERNYYIQKYFKTFGIDNLISSINISHFD